MEPEYRCVVCDIKKDLVDPEFRRRFERELAKINRRLVKSGIKPRSIKEAVENILRHEHPRDIQDGV